MPDAMARFAKWLGYLPELAPPREVSLADSVDLACDDDDQWLGAALYIYENDGWTVFEDLSGHRGSIPADSWLSFAESDDFVFAGYNDAIEYGELIVIENGTVVREFLFDADDPDANVNRGVLAGNLIEPLKTWIEVAHFVDDDDLAFSEKGLLWIHKVA